MILFLNYHSATQALLLASVRPRHLLRSQREAEGLWGNPREKAPRNLNGEPLGKKADIIAGYAAFWRKPELHQPQGRKGGVGSTRRKRARHGLQELGLLGVGGLPPQAVPELGSTWPARGGEQAQASRRWRLPSGPHLLPDALAKDLPGGTASTRHSGR